jgi:hypothetical protein
MLARGWRRSPKTAAAIQIMKKTKVGIEVKNRKTRIKANSQAQILYRDLYDRLDITDDDVASKLQAVDLFFAQSKENPDEFHKLNLGPLLDSGISLEDSLALLIDGILRPN